MALKTKTIKIEDPDSRDAGKSFVITEMPSDVAEWWAFRAIQALAKAGADIEGYEFAPLSSLARIGIQALAQIPPDEVKPLFDQMLTCVTVPVSGGATRQLRDGDIEEVGTRFKLRSEILIMHLGFFTNGVNQTGALTS